VARTPSKEAHDKVLNAALRLIAERGIEATSMDAIAAEAGVSKATVYKHWENKDALLIDTIRNHSDELPEFDSGNPREDMVRLVRYLAESRKREELGPVWHRIIGYAMGNPEFLRALQAFAFEPRRVRIQRIVAQAVEKGELRRGIDAALAADLLIGPVMHRRFSGDTMPRDMPERIVDYFWRVFAGDGAPENRARS
jgi:AcrR family transcriptional regulator